MVSDSAQIIADTVLDAIKSVSSPSFEEAARSIFTACKKLVGASSGYVALLSEDRSRNEVIFLDPGGLPCTVDPDLPMPIRGLRALSCNSAQPVVENTFMHSDYAAFLPEGHVPIDNALFAPMVIRDEVAGLIGLANKKGGFSEKDAEVTAILANGAALALEKTKLYDELAEKEKSLHTLCRDLQHRVEEKTAQLRQANIELQHQCRESKRIAEELKKSQECYRDVVETIDEGVILQEASGSIAAWNNSAEEMLQLSEHMLSKKGAACRDWPTVHEDGSKFHTQDLPSYTTLRTGTPCRNVPVGFMRKDGEICWASVNTRPVFKSGDTRPSAMVISFRDITEQRRLEQSLRHMQKMEAVGTLAGGIAHEFNNILAGILNYAELIREDARKSLPLNDSLDAIEQLGERAKHVVSQIAAFSSAGRAEKKPVQPHVLIAQEIEMMRAVIPSTISVERDIQNAGTIYGDPEHIKHIITNLCTNALQAMEHNGSGTLTIALSPSVIDADAAGSTPSLTPGPHMRLTVSDTGAGIDRQHIHRIFDPFFTTRPVGRGSGMGLSIVHGIVTSYGGAITAASTPGEGATFTVLIPAVAEKEASGEKEAQPCCGSEHILIVDDEDFVVFPLKKMLERQGYAVTALTSSPDALELFTENPGRYDLVITDLTMPHLNGEQLAREMIRIRQDLRIILMTGYSDLRDTERIQKSGVKAFVAKPCRKEDLIKTVRSVLDE